MFTLALEEAIEVDLVQEVIRMFRLKPPSYAPDTWPWPVRIFTLGRFKVQIDGENLEFSAQATAQDFAVIESNRGLGDGTCRRGTMRCALAG